MIVIQKSKKTKDSAMVVAFPEPFLLPKKSEKICKGKLNSKIPTSTLSKVFFHYASTGYG